MKVDVRFFAASRELLGTGKLAWELPVGATVQTLVEALYEAYPRLCSARLRFAVNSTYASLDTVLHDGDEVACIPPVGGG
jgi:molybdopterin converting factor subunit 1